MSNAATRAMKPSGLQNLPEIPVAWSRSKLGFESRVKARLGWKGLKADEYVDDGYVFLATPNIKGREIDFEHANYITEERYLESPELMLQADDVLLTKDGFTLGTANVVRTLPRPATVNGSIAVIRPGPRLHGIYLYYFFLSEFFQYFVHLMKDGMDILHLFQADLRWFDVLLPPANEQRAIADFLDRKTAAIDALIAKKERLIELLQEKRQALITQAVTKGLDPNVQLKGSGIEWLGEIPAHWEIAKLSWASRVTNGSTPNRGRPDYWEDGTVPWLASGKVNDYLVESPSEMVTEKALAECSIEVVPKGSVVIGMVGQGKTRGMSARLEIAACINQNMAAIIPSSQLHGGFLHQVLLHGYEPIREIGRGANQEALNCEIVAGLRIPLPPLSEQAQIAAYLEDYRSRARNVVSRIERHIDLLREYRQALITEAVTGKLEIPEVAEHAAAV